MDWSGVDHLWIIVMFLSAVWTLILTAPIHCWDSDVMLHFSRSDEETNSSTSRMAWGWVKFHQMFIFEWTIPWNSELRLNNFSKTVSGWTQRPASKKREGMNGHKHERMCVWGFSVDRWASVCRRGVNERYIGGTRLTSPQPGVTLITAISYSAISLSLSLSPPEAHMSTHTHTHTHTSGCAACASRYIALHLSHLRLIDSRTLIGLINVSIYRKRRPGCLCSHCVIK